MFSRVLSMMLDGFPVMVAECFVIARAVTLLMLTVISIQASVIYDFVGTGSPVTLPPPGGNLPPEPLAFRLTVPNFLNPPLNSGYLFEPGNYVFFTCNQLDSNTNCGPLGSSSGSGSVQFDNNNGGSPGTLGYSAVLGFAAANHVDYLFYFPTGAFGASGVHTSSSGNIGTLTVTQTPEPVTLSTVLAGLLFLGAKRLRSNLQRASTN